MSTADLNGTNYQAAGVIEHWTRDWELGETWLRCRHCVGFQPFAQAAGGESFTAHTPECPGISRGEQFPLHTLRAALAVLGPVKP